MMPLRSASAPVTLTDAVLVRLSGEDLKLISNHFEDKDPESVLRWATDRFTPDIALACSLGADDMVLLDMLSKIAPQTRIFYLDTGVLFKETYELRDQVLKRYNVNLVQLLPALTLEEQAAAHGPNLWERDPDLCCNIRKVQPLSRFLSGLQAWITGIRRDQTPARANSGIVELDKKFQLVKINPLARWTEQMVWDYIRANNVPYNPLHEQGYPSIGCLPCTSQVKPGEDPRSGRWRGFKKDECGLHCGAQCPILPEPEAAAAQKNGDASK
ncbi:MAG: phosphoadenylyl-sulfate reductase [Nitrospirota bacterium]